MGSAMVRGWLESGTLEAADIVLSDRDSLRAGALADEHGVTAEAGNSTAAGAARVVVLAVKPQDSAGVLEDIAGALRRESVVVSIVAGLSIASMRGKLGGEPSVVRVMPNLGAQVGASVSGYALDPGPGGLDASGPLRLLEAIGVTVEVGEEYLDLVTAVSGSGPAYFFLLTEALERAAVEMGVSADVARTLARETLWGAAKVLKETGREARDLREAVSSPGGTTLAALAVLDEDGFDGMISRAVAAARKRAGELTR
jgi:pyrroline-5-carboxylate reductase